MQSIIEPQRMWFPEYCRRLRLRASSKLPEMESTKALINILRPHLPASLLDVGCGCGHLYASLVHRNLEVDYTGVDLLRGNIRAARQIFRGQPCKFWPGSVTGRLPFPDNSFDVSVCTNLLHSFESIDTPIREILRATKKLVILRMLVYERSYRIYEVLDRSWHPNSRVPAGRELDSDCQPREAEPVHIYSSSYLAHIIKKHAPDAKIFIQQDSIFNTKALTRDGWGKIKNATKVLGRVQVDGCIILPWHFVLVKL